MNEPQVMHVMAGLLVDSRGHVLLAERPTGKHLAGFWEFPGGKVEPGESKLDALARELREELGIELTSATPLIRVPWAYDDRVVLLDAWRVEQWRGTPQSLEGQALQWCAPMLIDPAIMTPADRPILQALRLPGHYVTTPTTTAPHRRQACFDRLDDAIRCGTRLLQLRLPLWSVESVRALAADLLPSATQHGAQLLLHADIEGANKLGIGVHLDAAQLLSLSARPLPWNRIVGVSCRDATQLEFATSIRADFATLSPVTREDSSSTYATPDWAGFQAMVEAASLPVYAVKGISNAAFLADAQRCGAQGVAGDSDAWLGLKQNAARAE